MKKEIKEFDEIENLASRFHQVYQEELRRQDKKTFESYDYSFFKQVTNPRHKKVGREYNSPDL